MALLAILSLLNLVPAEALDPWATVLLAGILWDVALLRLATRWLTRLPAQEVDERQRELRDRSYRIAYRLLAAAVVGYALLAAFVVGSTPVRLPSSERVITALIILLIVTWALPTVVIAWLQPDAVVDDEPDPPSPVLRGAIGRMLGAAAVFALAVLWSSSALLPVRTSAVMVTPDAGASAREGCADYRVEQDVGYGLGAGFQLSAAACWDGHRARESFGLNATDCRPKGVTMAVVRTVICRRLERPDGSLFFEYAADVVPSLLPLASQRADLVLVVRPDGTVARSP